MSHLYLSYDSILKKIYYQGNLLVSSLILPDFGEFYLTKTTED